MLGNKDFEGEKITIFLKLNLELSARRKTEGAKIKMLCSSHYSDITTMSSKAVRQTNCKVYGLKY